MFVVRGIPLAFTLVIASGELPDSSDAIQWLKESCWMIISTSVESNWLRVMFWATKSSWGWLNLPSELDDFGGDFWLPPSMKVDGLATKIIWSVGRWFLGVSFFWWSTSQGLSRKFLEEIADWCIAWTGHFRRRNHFATAIDLSAIQARFCSSKHATCWNKIYFTALDYKHYL